MFSLRKLNSPALTGWPLNNKEAIIPAISHRRSCLGQGHVLRWLVDFHENQLLRKSRPPFLKDYVRGWLVAPSNNNEDSPILPVQSQSLGTACSTKGRINPIFEQLCQDSPISGVEADNNFKSVHRVYLDKKKSKSGQRDHKKQAEPWPRHPDHHLDFVNHTLQMPLCNFKQYVIFFYLAEPLKLHVISKRNNLAPRAHRATIVEG